MDQTPLNKEQSIRFQIAMKLDKPVEDLEAIYNWIMGPKQTVIPASAFTVVK